jgi:ABC-2 type transport system permease protein
MVRFFRQRSRVVGSLLTPLLFWVLFSWGYAPSSGSSFAYFFPGTVTLIILFTSTFTNISVIEDRREGFLQGVLVAPVPRGGIVLGKVLGGASIAALQALIFIALAVIGDLDVSLASPVWALAIVLLAVSLTSLGFAFAWSLDSIQGFHTVMNLVLMPLWILSGALFPAHGTPWPLHSLMTVNPVTYGLALMRYGLGIPSPHGPSLAVSAVVTVGFAVATFVAATIVATRRSEPGGDPR